MSIQPVNDQSPAVSAMSASTPMSMSSPPPAPALNGTLSGISQQLGMSVSDVQGAIRQGASIADLARQQGVSADAITQSVQGQVQKMRADRGQTALDPAALGRMVSRAVHHHHHRPVTAGASSGASDGAGGSSGSGGSGGSGASSGSGFSTLA